MVLKNKFVSFTKRRKAKDVATRRFKKNQAKLKLERGY